MQRITRRHMVSIWTVLGLSTAGACLPSAALAQADKPTYTATVVSALKITKDIPSFEDEVEAGKPDFRAPFYAPTHTNGYRQTIAGQSAIDKTRPVGPWSPPGDACALYAKDAANLLAAAACRGVAAFARGDFSNAFDKLLADVTRRRFGVEALDGMWGAYAAQLVSASTEQLRVYARVGDAAAVATPKDLAVLAHPNSYTSAALYCDVYPLARDYQDTLSKALVDGGYGATHVLLALMWVSDNGCADPTDAAFHERVLSSVAALIDKDLSSITDLEVEAASFLAYSGEGARIVPGFAKALLAAQRSDGGWSVAPSSLESNGHTTGLAVWYLHELLFPGRSETMVTRHRR